MLKKKTAPEDEHKPTLPTGTHVFLKASLNLQTLNQSKKKKSQISNDIWKQLFCVQCVASSNTKNKDNHSNRNKIKKFLT